MKTVDDTIMMSKEISNVVDVTTLESDKSKKKSSRMKVEQTTPIAGPLKCDVIFTDEDKLRCDVLEYRNTDIDISVTVLLHTHDMTVSMLSNEITGISMLAGDYEIVDIHCDVNDHNDRPTLVYVASGHSTTAGVFRDCSCITLTFKRDS